MIVNQRARRPRLISATATAALIGLAAAGSLAATRTATAATPTSVTFATAGDFGASAGTTDYLLRSIGGARPDYTLALGDLSYDLETPAAWCQRVKDQLNAGAGLAAGSAYGETFPFQVMLGNHDVATRDQFGACLPDRLGPAAANPAGVTTLGPAGYLRQYVVDSPAASPLVRTIALGTNTLDSYATGSPGLAWVAASIDDARAKGIRWVVVAVHENYVTVGANPAQVPASLMDLLLAKKVDLVLQSHDHNYQRSKQLSTSAACPSLPTGTANTACITGDGAPVAGVGTYTKGKGTVVLIVGTGGRPHYAVNPADPEAGYFAAWNSTAFGWAKLTATPTSLSGTFVNTGGAVYADAWTINEPAAPAPADTTAPTTPTNLALSTVSALTSTRSVALSWKASSDTGAGATGVTGYRILRGTTQVGTTTVTPTSTGTTFTDTTAPAARTSTYTVVAVDAAGNTSPASAPASVLLPTTATSATYTPTADATVNSGTPTTASGTGTQISASRIGTPYERSYLKFAVNGLGGRTITGARLTLTTTDASPVGGTLWTTSNAWTETVTWATSPAAGTWLGRYGAATVGTTNTFTIPTSTLPTAVPHEGTWSFLLSSSSGDRVRYSSREATTTAARPALVVSLATTDVAAPSAPGTPALTLAADRTTLTWAKATDDVAVTGYQVERNGVIVTTRAGTTWTDTAVTSGAGTTYRVRALDAAGRTGPWSTAVTGSTP